MIDLSIPLNRHSNSNSNSVSKAKICKCTTAHNIILNGFLVVSFFYTERLVSNIFVVYVLPFFPLELLTAFFWHYYYIPLILFGVKLGHSHEGV
jgi:hypothetical protein